MAYFVNKSFEFETKVNTLGKTGISLTASLSSRQTNNTITYPGS